MTWYFNTLIVESTTHKNSWLSLCEWTKFWLVIQIGQFYWHETHTLLLFMCAMENQLLTYVIVWCIFAVDLTNYMVNFKIPYMIIFLPSEI